MAVKLIYNYFFPQYLPSIYKRPKFTHKHWLEDEYYPLSFPYNLAISRNIVMSIRQLHYNCKKSRYFNRNCLLYIFWIGFNFVAFNFLKISIFPLSLQHHLFRSEANSLCLSVRQSVTLLGNVIFSAHLQDRQLKFSGME